MLTCQWSTLPFPWFRMWRTPSLSPRSLCNLLTLFLSFLTILFKSVKLCRFCAVTIYYLRYAHAHSVMNAVAIMWNREPASWMRWFFFFFYWVRWCAEVIWYCKRCSAKSEDSQEGGEELVGPVVSHLSHLIIFTLGFFLLRRVFPSISSKTNFLSKC